jgi:hypothetical protein
MLSMPSRDERRDPTHPTVSLFDGALGFYLSASSRVSLQTGCDQ